MQFILRHIKNNSLLYILLIFFTWIFFYKLDYSTLSSWDEAWYGSIAREMMRSRDLLHLVWNGHPFFDHPPLGFWFMALSYGIFGVTEFSTRLPSVMCGLLTIVFMYKLGELLFKHKVIGFVAALILATSVWYVIRVRSGNLDAPFVFFYVLTMYLSVKSSHHFKWFPVTLLGFGALVLTKTLIGFSALPLILFLNYKQIWHFKENKKNIMYGVGLFCLLVLPWYITNLVTYPDFFNRHFLEVGTRDKSLLSYFQIDPKMPLFFIHMGMRKWYYFWFVAVIYILGSLKFLKKEYGLLLIWNTIVLYPFLTSNQTELWHLIPVYIPISLLIAAGLYNLLNFIIGWLRKLHDGFGFINQRWFINSVYMLFFVVIAVVQVKVFYNEVFPASKYVGDDVRIVQKAARYKERIFLDDDYTPMAVFYSDRHIEQLSYYNNDRNSLSELFNSDEDHFVVIVRNWAVENLAKEEIPYTLLEKNNSFSIITR